MAILIQVVELLSFMLTAIVFLDIIVSFFLNPYHPLRRTLDSVVSPLLAPIRRILPPVGMLDLSPMVLLVIIWVVKQVLVGLLASIR